VKPPSSIDAPATLPTGTVVFLFSDIEGSTRRWDQHPEAMIEALRRHDALMREAIGAHGGHVFKTIGDAFCCAFDAVPSAVDAAVEAQRAIAAASWSDVGGLAVRMAIHVGLADERDGDYFGPSVNRVARLLATAHGGQILASGTAAGLIAGIRAAQVSLRDLGRHRLRDLANPEQVYQVVAVGIAEDFPPLRSVNALPNNLPLQLTTFVGRERETEEIENLLSGVRLLTLVGTGGVGKTRSAIQIAANVLDGMPDRAWFVDLAAIGEATSCHGAILSALGLQEDAGRPALATILDHLAHRKLLLVLDNCEHVIEETARTAHEILKRCKDVKIIATSRESLRVDGEHVYRMPSLTVPQAGESLTVDRALAYGAVALFAERAAAADSRFTLTDENVATVSDICRRLDGIALAIELAAPRVKMFSVAQLSQRLGERFRLLTGGRRTALPRQQTMRALIDWSYDLLDGDQQSLFRRLGVFSGGWSLAAATSLSENAQTSEWEVFDLLSALVEKSLVQVDLSESAQRYRLLESMKEYAREALQSSGGFETVAAAHCRHFLAVARTVDDLFVNRGDSNDAFAMASIDVDNFRAALAWALGEGHDELAGCEIAGRLSILWSRAFRYEGARWLKAALDRTAGDPRTMARVLLALAHVLPDGVEKVARSSEAVAAYRAIEEPLPLAAALSSQAEALRAIGRYAEAAAAQAEGVALYRSHGNPALVTSALLTLGSIETIAGNRENARRLLEEARRLNPNNGSASTNLAELEFADGNLEAAVSYAREALEYFKDRHRSNACIVLCNLAAYSLALGRADSARAYAREGLAMAQDMRLPDLVALAIQHLASVAITAGDADRAARLCGYVDARYAALGLTRDTSEQYTYERLRAALDAASGPEAIATATVEGAAMSDDHAVALALSA
jgi:predicted ATPase/class 3 adenylate cyclase